MMHALTVPWNDDAVRSMLDARVWALLLHDIGTLIQTYLL